MKLRFNTDKTPTLKGKERIPFEKINAKLITLNWDSSIEYDQVWGWYILACKNDSSWGTLLRRIKPFKIISADDLPYSLKFQEKHKSDLIEVVAYKVYKGSRIFFPEITDFMDFMTEAKFQLFRKFFKTLDFSLNRVDKTEAEKKESHR